MSWNAILAELKILSHKNYDIPLSEYAASDIDETNSTVVIYYGNIAKQGQWYILKHDIVANTFRYTSGESDYITQWLNRLNLDYDYYNKIGNI